MENLELNISLSLEVILSKNFWDDNLHFSEIADDAKQAAGALIGFIGVTLEIVGKYGLEIITLITAISEFLPYILLTLA